MSTLADAITYVYRALRDTGDTEATQLLTDSEITAFIANAIARYSAQRPRDVTADVTADGTIFVPLPSTWEAGFSTLTEVEYPVSATDLPTIIDERYYRLWQTPTATKILWLDGGNPAANAAVRIRYTILHTITASATTVPEAHFYALCEMAIALCAESISAKYANTRETALAADAVGFQTKSQQWASVARRAFERFKAVVGTRSVGGGRINWDSAPGFTGSWLTGDRLTHPRRIR
jgi:hypothetical protein